MLEHVQMLRETARSPAPYLATRDETNRSAMGGCSKYLPKPPVSCLKSVSLPPVCGINMQASASSLSITRGTVPRWEQSRFQTWKWSCLCLNVGYHAIQKATYSNESTIISQFVCRGMLRIRECPARLMCHRGSPWWQRRLSIKTL